jgi:hypothetical protein
MSLYARGSGVLVEPIGHLWAAFSPATGETSLLNDETASILEVLSLGSASTGSVCACLAGDSGLDANMLSEVVEACWPRLIESGLVREQSTGHVPAR